MFNEPSTATVKLSLTSAPAGATGVSACTLRVPHDVTLAALHEVVQAAMGWDDSEPHSWTEWNSGTPRWTLPHLAEGGELDSTQQTLDEMCPMIAARLCYEYGAGSVLALQVIDLDPAEGERRAELVCADPEAETAAAVAAVDVG